MYPLALKALDLSFYQALLVLGLSCEVRQVLDESGFDNDYSSDAPMYSDHEEHDSDSDGDELAGLASKSRVRRASGYMVTEAGWSEEPANYVKDGFSERREII
jgi:hypothetical protein